MAEEKKLTAKQKAFVQEYLIDLNATQAAIRAGYSADTANEQGSRLLTYVSVQEALQEAMADREKRVEITQDMVLKELAQVGFSKIDDFLKVDDFEVIVGFEKGDDGNDDHSKPIKRMIRGVEVFKTDDIPKNKLAAVSEIRQTKEGISLKLHDKMKAVELIGRHLAMFTDKSQVDVTIRQKLEEFMD